jgi:hypothetical protein
MGLGSAGLGTGLLRGGANQCGLAIADCGLKGQGQIRNPQSEIRNYVAFFSRISPFTVDRESDRPPAPIVPRIRRGPKRPETVRG